MACELHLHKQLWFLCEMDKRGCLLEPRVGSGELFQVKSESEFASVMFDSLRHHEL